MELIVGSFLLIGLLLVGDIGTVIADQLRRPTRRVFRLAEDAHKPPPPPKRAPSYLSPAAVQGAHT